jgi:hypothetical protein
MSAAIRPSQPRVPTASVQNQFYVYSTDNNHVGPVNAELIARGVLAGRVPDDAYVAPVGSTNWVPMQSIAELTEAIRTARSTPSSMRPTALANGTPSVMPPPPPVPRDLMNGPTVVAPQNPGPGPNAQTGVQTVVSPGPIAAVSNGAPNPFAPATTVASPAPAPVAPAPATQLSAAAANGPTSAGPTSVPPASLQPQAPQPQPQPAPVPHAAGPASNGFMQASPGFAPIQAPPAVPAMTPAPAPVTPQPGPAPAAAAAVASPSISPTPPKGGEEKKEEKKPVLDPRFKYLPLAIFGAFAIIGVIETAIVLITR